MLCGAGALKVRSIAVGLREEHSGRIRRDQLTIAKVERLESCLWVEARESRWGDVRAKEQGTHMAAFEDKKG